MEIKDLDVESLQDAFKQQGFISIEGFLSGAEVAELRTEVGHFMDAVVPHMPIKHVFYENQVDKGSLKQLQHLDEYSPYFTQLMFGSKFEQLAEILLGEKVIGRNLQYFNKPPKIGKPTPAHQDGYYFMLTPPSAVTMWLALEKVDEANGVVRYIPGSHKEGSRGHSRTNTLGFSQGIMDYGDDDLKREVYFPAEAGHLLVHHALTIHRADGNQSERRSRQALGFIYYGKSAKEDKVRHEAYQAQLAKELK